ncbi:TIR domain-containing protein [Desulfovibrio sp. OttesenSCG-928-C14]|nr:TIR domain-containing protein [Desulfovibrio sp. OttesenSCG-928-C14]
MRYDAFISYCHGGLDGLVAEQLHRLLESYRVPPAIAKKTGKKRIRRVFRDRDELPTSADLSGSIEEALRESEFLILICSKRTCRSRWVLREVERFTELGGRDRIITVLIDGEPEESFPPQVRWREKDGRREEVEPLAADLRAPGPKQSLKLLRREKLRILAPMLGCAYDDLRQRGRERAFRSALAGALAALLLALGFSAYSSTQLMRINEQMRMKLYNQSFVLAEYSAEALKRGDPVSAALLALEGLPKNPEKPERPLVSAAEMALANAIGAYEYRETFVPHRFVDLPAKPGYAALSPDEAHLAVLLRDHTLLLLDPEDGSTLLSLDAAVGHGRGVVFPAPGVMVYAGKDGLTALSIPKGEILWQKEVAHGLALSADSSTIAASCEGRILFLDAASGAEKTAWNTRGRSSYLASRLYPPLYDCLELSEDGSLLAVNFTDGALYAFRAEDGSETLLAGGAARASCAFDADYLGCAWLALPPGAAYAAQGEESHMALFDRKNLARAWEQSRDSKLAALSLDGGLAFAQGGRLFTQQPGRRRGATLALFPEPILALKEKNGRILAGLEDGRIALRPLYSEDTDPAAPAGAAARVVMDDASYSGALRSGILALGERFAVAGGAASEQLRILKWNERKADAVYPHNATYVHSNAVGAQVYLHDLEGVRVLDAQSGKITLTLFRAETGLTSTFFPVDEKSGNLVRQSAGACALYSAQDGTRLFEAALPCELTQSGLSVLEEDELVLVDPASGREKARYPLPEKGRKARLYGQWLVGGNGEDLLLRHVQSGQTRIFPGREFLAAYPKGEDLLLCSFGQGFISVHSLRDQAELFRLRSPKEVPGVFFMAEGHFLALTFFTRPSQAYALPDGEPVGDLSHQNYMLFNVLPLPGSDLFLTLYAEPVSGESLGLIRKRSNLEPVASIPGCLGVLDGRRLLVAGNGNIKAVPWRSAEQIRAMAEEFVAAHTLTPEQRKLYHVVE